jgi:hypothetical protein
VVAANSNTGIAEAPQNGGNGEANENAADAESACPIPGADESRRCRRHRARVFRPSAQNGSHARDVTLLAQVV